MKMRRRENQMKIKRDERRVGGRGREEEGTRALVEVLLYYLYRSKFRRLGEEKS